MNFCVDQVTYTVQDGRLTYSNTGSSKRAARFSPSVFVSPINQETLALANIWIGGFERKSRGK